MIIGTDISLKECKAEGYLMMKYDARRKFNHDIAVDFIQYMPEYTRSKKQPIENYILRTGNLDTSDIFEAYERNKKAIQDFADYHIESIDEIKNYYDLLLLADNVNAYSGWLFE
jgi:hypothetical protein